MTDLNSLAERCEKATGPDRKLDSDIVAALDLAPGWAGKRGEGINHATWSSGRDYWDAPSFTASVDAAMTLVPEGWRFIIDSDGCHCRMTRKSREGRDVTGFAGSMALALCAAALRARAGGE